MKSFLLAVLAAVVIAIGSAYVLNTRFQQYVDAAFSTSGVRL
ncbi:MAG: hypothetical protein NZM07_06875 [Elioraea sp.]|nr:hypothetical protein [Elioraea sp.]